MRIPFPQHVVVQEWVLTNSGLRRAVELESESDLKTMERRQMGRRSPIILKPFSPLLASSPRVDVT